MEFNQFKKMMQEHITEMLKDVDILFQVDVDKDYLWNLYLDSLPEGTNLIYRERREFDCSSCRHFVKTFGNVVTLKNGILTTVWDFHTFDPVFQPVIDALGAFISQKAVSDVFVTSIDTFGVDKNHGEDKEKGNIRTWEHLYYKLPKKFINRGGDTDPTVMGKYRDVKNVFMRSLTEISEEAITSVLELISQNSLYKGEEWDAVLKQFLKLHKDFHKIKSGGGQDRFCWEQSVKVGPVIGKIRNHSMGTLLTDITNGVELDEAVRKYEAMVAPENYKRPQAIFTKKMLEDAKKKLEELGLVDALERRYATLDDITVNNILFANKDAAKRIGGSVFDDMAQSVAVNPKSFDKVEEVTIENFVKDILPTVKKIEAFVENRHAVNMVSLIAPKNKDSKTMFKWNNGFSWAYSGNITDSMKQRVKAAGGKVDGVLRFSIQWNDDGDNDNDFDAHCLEPRGHIYFGNKRCMSTGGTLDVDIRSPRTEIGNRVAVENITWPDRNRMCEGIYEFSVHNFCHRGGRKGFSAEIEFDGQIFSFNYDKELRSGQAIVVATVRKCQDGSFEIVKSLPSSSTSRDVWGLSTNQFHPVSVCMFSPNYWDEQDGIGNRHYFFMLKDCVNPEGPNGFFNEYLREDLLTQKRVFEALGAKMKVEDVKDQLSGIGFSSTKHETLVVKVEGAVSRTLKIKF